MNDRESVLDELISLVGIDSFGVCSHNTVCAALSILICCDGSGDGGDDGGDDDGGDDREIVCCYYYVNNSTLRTRTELTGDIQGDRDRSDKMKILERYKFYLAFENSSEDDYVTEKIYHALRVGSVPGSCRARSQHT